MATATREKENGRESNTLIIEDPALAHGFVQLPKPILYARNLSAEAKLLYAVLLGYAWQEEHCYPGVFKMCDDMGISENTLRKRMAELVETGLLKVKRRGQGKTNVYILADLRSSKIEVQEMHNFRSSNSEVLEPQVERDLEPHGLRGIEESVEVESVEKQTGEEDSNLTSLDNFDRPIEMHLRSIAAELHDEAPLKSSLTRVLRLWADTEIDADEFVQVMAEAKQKTQKYSASIRKKAEKPGNLLPTKNKMPYFMKVLEDMLGLGQQAGDQK